MHQGQLPTMIELQTRNGQQIAGAQGVSEFLELAGITPSQEGAAVLLEVDFLFLESLRQPVLLIQADAR